MPRGGKQRSYRCDRSMITAMNRFTVPDDRQTAEIRAHRRIGDFRLELSNRRKKTQIIDEEVSASVIAQNTGWSRPVHRRI